MYLHGTSRIDQEGHLTIGECRASDLAAEFGTPLIVYDEDLIRERMRAYREPFARRGVDGIVAYASKAFSSARICRIVREEGLWLDVVSAGELHTALRAEFPPERIFMHGNNKTMDELQYAVEAGIGLFVIDNFLEIEMLDGVLRQNGKSADVLLRVSPGVDAHTHEFITTGRQDSKFGFDLFSGQAMQAAERVSRRPAMRLRGLHSHIGSQIFDVDGFRVAAQRLAHLYADIEQAYAPGLDLLNLGGGLGIRYTAEDMLPPIGKAVDGVIEASLEPFRERGLNVPTLMLEPGRSLVAEAGTTLYRIGSRKDIPELRTYLAVDGGMTDNPRLALYGAKYEAAVANRMREPADELVSVAGKCCESGDMLIWDVRLPRTCPGDLLAVSCTGAYNYSMASNYNRIARPAVVFVHAGEARLAIRRETLDDVCRLDVLS